MLLQVKFFGIDNISLHTFLTSLLTAIEHVLNTPQFYINIILDLL